MTDMLCHDCNTIALFVSPGCEDGHEDCLDLMCVLCGAAITFGAFSVPAEDPERRSAA